MYSGAKDKRIKKWDLKNDSFVYETVKIHTHCINVMAITPDCEYLFPGNEDGDLKQWSLENGLKLVRDFGEVWCDGRGVKYLVVTENGKDLFVSGESKVFFLWGR